MGLGVLAFRTAESLRCAYLSASERRLQPDLTAVAATVVADAAVRAAVLTAAAFAPLLHLLREAPKP